MAKNRYKEKRIVIVTLLAIMLLSTQVCSAASKTYTSSANKDSKKIKYTFTAEAERTGSSTAKVTWSLKPTWADGGEGHDSPTKVTVSVKCGNDFSKDYTIKSKGSNSLKTLSGSFTATVGQKTTSRNISFSASGSGVYYTQREVSYTYYTTEYTHYYVVGGLASITVRCCSSRSHSYNGAYVKSNYYTVGSVAHTGTKMVTDTHNTNSGTIKKQTLTMTFTPWVNVRYNTLSGTPQPASHGFVYNKGANVTNTTPKWYDNTIQQYAYTCLGWTKTAYTLDQLTSYPSFQMTAQYQAGVAGKNIVKATEAEKTNDIMLYAVYKPNVVANIYYRPNAGAEYNDRVTGIPGSQKKTYRVPLQLSTGRPTHPETVNKGVRRVFLWWSFTADHYEPGDVPVFNPSKNFRPGDTINVDRNPYEAIQKGADGLNIINLYAVWWDEVPRGGKTDESAGPDSHIRYIDKENINSLTEDSSWRTGQKQQILEESLNKKDQQNAKSVYDSEGNKVSRD